MNSGSRRFFCNGGFSKNHTAQQTCGAAAQNGKYQSQNHIQRFIKSKGSKQTGDGGCGAGGVVYNTGHLGKKRCI